MKKTLDNVQIKDKGVLIRVDFNVPISNGKITDDTRIKEAVPTIEEILKKKAKYVIVMSHLGRVKTEDDKAKLTLRPVFERLKELLPKTEVVFAGNMSQEEIQEQIEEWRNPEITFGKFKFKIPPILSMLSKRRILVLNNTRYYDVEDNKVVNKESKCSEDLSKFFASLADVFVNDAFGTAHRKHASNFGVASEMDVSCIGRLAEKELKALGKVLNNPEAPVVAIIGGAKVSDKIGVLSTFLHKADKVIVGGGMAYTFMVARGQKIGTSLFEEDRLPLAKELLEKYGDKIVLPDDNFGAKKFSNEAEKFYFDGDITDGMMGLDIGTKSITKFQKVVVGAKTILWNGPMGVCEFSNYENGTLELAKAIGKEEGAYKVVGGGDSVAAINKLNLEGAFSHISTGGGASLTFLEGKELVGFSSIQEEN